MSEIFLFNIFVSHLRLRSEIVQDAGETTFLVKIKFNNLPTVIIREKGSPPKILTDDNSFEYIFDAGEFQYFSRKIDELMKMLRENPLKIGVFREGDSFPLCQVQIPLFGCACSLIWTDVKKNISKDFTIDDQFNLSDPGDNPAGEIFINAALINCGRSVASYYRPQRESFTMKKIHQGTEFEFVRNSDDSEVTPPKQKKIKASRTEKIDLPVNFQQFYQNFMKYLILISPSSRYLSKEEQSNKTAHISGKKGKRKKSGKKKEKKKK